MTYTCNQGTMDATTMPAPICTLLGNTCHLPAFAQATGIDASECLYPYLAKGQGCSVLCTGDGLVNPYLGTRNTEFSCPEGGGGASDPVGVPQCNYPSMWRVLLGRNVGVRVYVYVRACVCLGGGRGRGHLV